MTLIVESFNLFDPSDRVVHNVTKHTRFIDWLTENYPDGFDCPRRVYKNNVELSVADYDTAMTDDDQFSIIPRVEDPVTTVAVAVGVGIGVLVARSAGGSGTVEGPDGGYLDSPGTPTSASMPNRSIAYNIRSKGNLARPGETIPAVYGEFRLYPDLAAKSYVSTINGVAFLMELFCVGQGTVDVTDTKRGDKPIINGTNSHYTDAIINVVQPFGSLSNFEVGNNTISSINNQLIGPRYIGEVRGYGYVKSPGVFNQSIEITAFNNVSSTDYDLAHTQTELTDLTLMPAGVDVRVMYATSEYDTFNTWFTDGFSSLTTNKITFSAFAFTAPFGDNRRFFRIQALQSSTPSNVTFEQTFDLTSATYEDIDTVSLTFDFIVASDRGVFDHAEFMIGVKTNVNSTYQYSTHHIFRSPGSTLTVSKTILVNLYDRAVAMSDTTDITSITMEINSQYSSYPSYATKTLYLASAYYSNRTQVRNSTFGNVTLVETATKRSDLSNEESDLKFNLVAKRKLREYNYTTGVFGNLIQTSSIADALIDIYTAHYGYNGNYTNIDLTSLAALETTWTSRGDTFNGVFDQPVTVWEALTRVARAGRARPVMMGSKLTFVRDASTTSISAMFTPANIVKNTFNKTYTYQDDKTTKYINVKYHDKAFDYKEKELTFNENSQQSKQVFLYGITKYEQAKREFLYLNAVKKYRTQQITFSTELEGLIPMVGDRISVTPLMPVYGQWGQIQAINGTTLTLSEKLPDEYLSESTLYLRFRNLNGSPSDVINVTPVANNANQVTTASVINLNMSNYTDNPHYSLGKAGKTAMDCIVTNIQPTKNKIVRITATNYNESVYTADTGDVPDKATETTIPDIARPTGVKVTKIRMRNQIPLIRVEWNPVNSDASTMGYVLTATKTTTQEKSSIRFTTNGHYYDLNWFFIESGNVYTFSLRAEQVTSADVVTSSLETETTVYID